MKNYEEMTIKELEKEIEEMNKAQDALNTKKKLEEEAKAKKLAEEKDARYAAIETESKKLQDMIKDYMKDYGSFNFKRTYDDDYYPLNLLRRFFL